MNPIAIRLLSQQQVAPQYSDPAEVVSYMGAMQAQEYRMMRWAVEMRTRKPSHKAFKKAFDSGQIIRLHLMRGTWQLVSAEDYWMMVGLCAPKAIAVTKGWMSSNKISIPDDELYHFRDILAQTAADLGSATKEDFVHALEKRGIKMDDHALTANKVKQTAKIDRDEALMRFTRKYFQSRQPATLEDFVWWSGLNVSDCRKGIALLGDSVHVEKWKGREFYLTDDCRTRGFRKGKFLLIPPYDEYLISYKSRDIVLSPEHRHHAHNNSGIFQPVIAYDGTICGNWLPFKDDCQATFFAGQSGRAERFSDTDAENITEAWQSYKHYLAR